MVSRAAMNTTNRRRLVGLMIRSYEIFHVIFRIARCVEGVKWITTNSEMALNCSINSRYARGFLLKEEQP